MVLHSELLFSALEQLKCGPLAGRFPLLLGPGFRGGGYIPGEVPGFLLQVWGTRHRLSGLRTLDRLSPGTGSHVGGVGALVASRDQHSLVYAFPLCYICLFCTTSF